MDGKHLLREEQIAFYSSNGFIQLNDVLSQEEVESLRAGIRQVQEDADALQMARSSDPEYTRIFLQMVNLWRVNETVRDYVLSPKMAAIARQLAGVGRIRLWHDHALIKLPRDSKPSAWHQDRPYWPHIGSDSLSCWMALDDVNEDNGCMWFVPQSHRWGLFEPIRLTDPQDLFALVPDPESKDFMPVAQPMKAGSCTFHSSLMFHYAGPNRTQHPRRALVTIYMADGTAFDGKRHVCTDGLGLNAGQMLDGELFPVVG